MMKFKTIFFLFASAGLMLSYHRPPLERLNGWYYITDGRKDSVSLEPIVTVKDFVNLKLDSLKNAATGQTVYYISGSISRYVVDKWADATEKSVGKRIGFVYENQVISDPQVNERIESGNFVISTYKGYDLKGLYQSICREKIDTLRYLFNGWEIDLVRSDQQRDSMMLGIDYWMAKDLLDIFEPPCDFHRYSSLVIVGKEYRNLEKALHEKLQELNVSSQTDDYMKSEAYIRYKDFIYKYPEYIKVMFESFLFQESPKGLYGYLIDDIVKTRFPLAPGIREAVMESIDEKEALFRYKHSLLKIIKEEN